MFKFLKLALMALAVSAAPLAAEADTHITVGIGVSARPAMRAVPYFARPPRLSQREIEYRLLREGYLIEHIDRRGAAYFVRVVIGYDVFDGLVDCDDGHWIARALVGYDNRGRGLNRGGSYGDHGWHGRGIGHDHGQRHHHGHDRRDSWRRGD